MHTLLFTLLALFVTGATAEERTGFVGGLGGGLYWNTIAATVSADDGYGSATASDTTQRRGLSTVVRLGYAPTPRTVLQYLRYATWTGGDDGGTYIIGLTGLGATFYLRPSTPSPYLTLGYGLADLTEVQSQNASPGQGWLFALGNEVRPHLHLEASVLLTRFQETGYDPYSGLYLDARMASAATGFTVQYLWY